MERLKIYLNWGRVDIRLRGGGWSREGWKMYVSYFKKHSISMLLNKSFLFGPWPLINRPTSRAARKKNWGFRVLAGSNRKHRFAVPVRKCLHSHFFFFLKLVGGAWLPMTKFFCCYILYFVLKLQLIKYPSMQISTEISFSCISLLKCE